MTSSNPTLTGAGWKEAGEQTAFTGHLGFTDDKVHSCCRNHFGQQGSFSSGSRKSLESVEN